MEIELLCRVDKLIIKWAQLMKEVQLMQKKSKCLSYKEWQVPKGEQNTLIV